MTSLNAAKLHNDSSKDMVFIDADHSEKAVIEDINAWWSKVKSKGWIGGHDYDYPGANFGVKKAVDTFARTNSLPLQVDVDYTWFLQKP